MTILDQLRAVIRKDKRSLRQIAEHVGVSYSAMRRFVTSKTPVLSADTMVRIADRLGYDVVQRLRKRR